MAPDAADLPRQIITEVVVPNDIDSQLEALAAHSVSLFRSEITRSGDTVDSLLKRLNIVDAEAAAFMREDPVARGLFTGRSGKMIQARTDGNGRVEELVARYAPDDANLFDTHFARLRMLRSGDGAAFSAKVEFAPLQAQQRLGSGTIRQSLFAAADDARIPDVVASQIAEIFSADIDFRRQLRRGDTFTVVYEALTADGEQIRWNQGAGRVLAAEFVNDGTVHSAVWFSDPDAGGSAARGAYYDMNGQNKRRSFLASPLEFSRVTSGFSMRLHPILRTWRQHKGVDYGAPTGTAVRIGRRRRGRVCRPPGRLRQRGQGSAQQQPQHRLRAPEPGRCQARPAGRTGRSRSPPSARPDGPPGRTSTSNSSSTATTSTR